MDCAEAECLVRRLFVAPDGTLFARVRDHLRGCRTCRATYDRLFAAEGSLGGDAALPAAQRGLLREVALGRPRRRFWGRAWFYAPAAAAAAAALLLVGLLPRGPAGRTAAAPAEDFAARGAATLAPAAVGIRALCLKGEGDNVSVEPLVSGHLPRGEQPRCLSRDRLGLTYWNETPTTWYLAVVVRGERAPGRLVFPTDEPSARVPPQQVEDALAVSLPLETYGPGTLLLRGIFSRRPLPAQRLLEALAEPRPEEALRRAGADHVATLAVEIGR
ncbi:MAG: hypothetical protein HY906_03245 [Deltaproteobacteria bacterium]|nr:hypothetical protein [Deltaproteobacteria bacterium]